MRCAGVVLVLACVSCTAQNVYTTPRTVGDDRSQWTAAPEMVFTTLGRKPPCVRDDDFDACPIREKVFPAMQFSHRVGIGERFEIGVFFPNGVGADLKWHALHAGPFDLALMPRVSFAARTLRSREPPDDSLAFSGMFVQMPILASIEVGRVTFVVSPGPVELLDFTGRITHGARVGFGIQWRVGERLAIHPEITMTDEYAGRAELNAGTLGLGFVWKDLAPANDQ